MSKEKREEFAKDQSPEIQINETVDNGLPEATQERRTGFFLQPLPHAQAQPHAPRKNNLGYQNNDPRQLADLFPIHPENRDSFIEDEPPYILK